MTKHQQLIEYIENLPIGKKISVRQIARELEVSEGTAYRAIKEAETRGMVSTMSRVGTVRIELKEEHSIQILTFAEVVNIVDGSILGGRAGLHKTLNKFLIGAMEIDSLARYVEADSLLIVGDREEAQVLALTRGASVMITGGFEASALVKELADSKEIPLISSTYDTFTIATMINQAIHDRLIKKEIIRAQDVMVGAPFYLKTGDDVAKVLDLSRKSGHSRFPVVDDSLRVVGIITGRDLVGISPETPLERVMTKKAHTVELRTSVAAVAHKMVWQGIEMLPVVENNRLKGVVTREDVIKALQISQRQPHVQMTYTDNIVSQFRSTSEGNTAVLRGCMPAVAMDRSGGVSQGALLTVMLEAAAVLLRRHRFPDIVPEGISTYFLQPVPPERELEVRARLIDVGRHTGKVDIDIACDGSTVCKAMASVQSLKD
ncbi:MAG TPA: hypothetical protein DEA85_07395 [Firmicutes bacterium]|nr:hypothetical protein [Bacillota bacterium]